MVPSLTTTLATLIVIVAGASKPYLPIISPFISIMAGGACATLYEAVLRGQDHERRRGHDHAHRYDLHDGRGQYAHDHHVAVIAAAHVSRRGWVGDCGWRVRLLGQPGTLVFA